MKSNCLSVAPVETEFGRKRQIDQSTCNKDYSCVKGFCPSFVTVLGGGMKKPPVTKAGDGHDEAFAGMPEPSIVSLDKPTALLVTGIGGTGVVTIGGSEAPVAGAALVATGPTTIVQNSDPSSGA